jgi:hypothetical protein
MNLFLLLLSSLFLGFVCYYSFIRMRADVRRPFILLLAYRFFFFAVQSTLFYTIYNNQLDAFFYHTSLVELADDFRKYPSDILLFFQGNYNQMHLSMWLQQYLQEEIRVAFFLKVLLPFFIFSANNYYMLGAWLTLFGTLCYMPFLSMKKYTPVFSIWLLVLLIPSFTIWTVGVLKEAFVIPVLFLLFYYFNRIINAKGKDIFSVVLFTAFFLLVWFVKYYLAAIFLLICVVYFISERVQFSRRMILGSVFLIMLLVIGLGYLHPALHWNNIPEVIYISYNLTCTKYVDAYACIPFDIEMSWTSILLNFPKAMLYAFFSPFPWQIHNVSSLLVALESYLFIALAGGMIYRVITKKIHVLKIEWLALFLIILIGGLLILASPNIGSFNRYRIFYLPVYTFILIKYSGFTYASIFLRFKKRIE